MHLADCRFLLRRVIPRKLAKFRFLRRSDSPLNLGKTPKVRRSFTPNAVGERPLLTAVDVFDAVSEVPFRPAGVNPTARNLSLQTASEATEARQAVQEMPDGGRFKNGLLTGLTASN